ncbi:chitinase [Haloechinothrix sp. LS1_15]|nr:chitinase [Haloechinothrix sp. LS1_15]
MPERLLTGYWHNFDNDSTVLRLADVPSEYDIVAAAFGVEDREVPGGVDFAVSDEVSDGIPGGYSDADFIDDVAELQQRGTAVILSVGGERDNVRVDTQERADNFADSLYGLMDEFGFDGVDIDLEHGIEPTYLTSAMRQLSDRVGPELVITMAPQTLDMQSTTNDYFRFALNIKDILTVVNTQYYNSGSMNGCDGNVYAQGSVEFIAALTCIQLENGLDPEQVGVGLPATPSAAGGGYVDPSVVNDALDCLATGQNCGDFTPPDVYPEIRGAMTWSINWDATNDYAFAETVAPHLDTLP